MLHHQRILTFILSGFELFGMTLVPCWRAHRKSTWTHNYSQDKVLDVALHFLCCSFRGCRKSMKPWPCIYLNCVSVHKPYQFQLVRLVRWRLDLWFTMNKRYSATLCNFAVSDALMFSSTSHSFCRVPCPLTHLCSTLVESLCNFFDFDIF